MKPKVHKKYNLKEENKKPNEYKAEYDAELKRLYDKAYSQRDAQIWQEDLLQRSL